MTAIESARADEDYDAMRLEGALRDVARGIERYAETPLPNSGVGETVDAIVGSLKQRVAHSPTPEDIQAVIGDLQTMRKIVQMQSARIQHEIAEYERLNLAAMEATRIVTEGLDIVDETDSTNDEFDTEGVETAPPPRLPLPRWGER